METQEAIFAHAAFWKRVGEEYLNPLIVTGALRFAPQSRSGVRALERETFDSAGRRRIERIPQSLTEKGFILSARFVFIDGATGAVLHTVQYSEGVLYDDRQNTPALASYFELMDRLVPDVLMVVAPQTVRTTRTLLR